MKTTNAVENAWNTKIFKSHVLPNVAFINFIKQQNPNRFSKFKNLERKIHPHEAFQSLKFIFLLSQSADTLLSRNGTQKQLLSG